MPSASFVPSSAALLVAITVLGLSAACDTRPDSTSVVQDSAGIPVVRNTAEGRWGPGESWRLEEDVRLGGSAAEEELELGLVSGVDVDAEGNIYLVDGQVRRVSVFDPDGSLRTSFGRPGSGPGELGLAIQGPFVTADGGIRLVDVLNQRVVRFSEAGESVGGFRLDLTMESIPVRWDEGPDDRLVVQFRSMSFSDTASAAAAGDPLVVLADDGTVEDTLTVLPPGESFQMRGGQVRMRMFESEPMWDVGPDGTLVSGRNHQLRLEVRNFGGELLRVVSLPVERRPVTEQDRETFYDAIAEAAERQGIPAQALEMMRSTMTFADFYPAFAGLIVGPGGTLWVQRVRTAEDVARGDVDFNPQEMGSPEWDVFDEDGTYLGVVPFPERFQPLRVIGERFWGIARDPLDVQSVVAYRLVR